MASDVLEWAKGICRGRNHGLENVRCRFGDSGFASVLATDKHDSASFDTALVDRVKDGVAELNRRDGLVGKDLVIMNGAFSRCVGTYVARPSRFKELIDARDRPALQALRSTMELPTILDLIFETAMVPLDEVEELGPASRKFGKSIDLTSVRRWMIDGRRMPDRMNDGLLICPTGHDGCMTQRASATGATDAGSNSANWVGRGWRR